jgi:hypothetical protein
MKKELIEYLETVTETDTTPTRERLESIRNEARREVIEENERTVANGTTHQD